MKKTIAYVSTFALWVSLQAAACNVTPCECSYVAGKESLAAGWCVLRVYDCDGTENEYSVDEVVYNSYNVGDCYP